MKKIGKLNRILFLFLLIFISHKAAFGQELDVSGTLSPTQIYSGEQVSYTLTISGKLPGNLRQPELPEIEGLRWLKGQMSTSKSYVLKNGQARIEQSFNYILIAEDPGSYTFPGISLSIEQETYTTDPVNFRVLDPAKVDPQTADEAPQIYVRLEPSSDSPVVGEQVRAEIVLYFKNGINVTSYQASPGWKAEGFWKEELQNPQRAQTTSTLINGVRYQRARLLQYALFPTKSGELTLSPFEISVTLRQNRRSNSVFDLGFNRERKNLQTLPVTLNVRRLPELERGQYIGAVGSFEVSRSIRPHEALVGESIEVITRISGSGNIPLVNKPEYAYPDGLELYNPQENSSISRSNQEISGRKTFTDVLIARNEGTYSVPELELAYFDPNKNDYSMITLPALEFTAERDPNTSISTENNLRLNISPVTGLARWTQPNQAPLSHKVWVWLLLFLPALSTAGVFAYKKYRDRMQSDTAFARSQKAASKARETLDKAGQATSLKEGYHFIDKALTQFITDKLNLPPAGISHERMVSEVLKVTDEKTSGELKKLFNKCETISYAPNASQSGMERDIEKSRDIIKRIGKDT